MVCDEDQIEFLSFEAKFYDLQCQNLLTKQEKYTKWAAQVIKLRRKRTRNYSQNLAPQAFPQAQKIIAPQAQPQV